MKLSTERVERAAKALADIFERSTGAMLDEQPAPWDELGDHARELAREMAVAALEAALEGLPTATAKRVHSGDLSGIVSHIGLPESWIGKCVALVPLDD